MRSAVNVAGVGAAWVLGHGSGLEMDPGRGQVSGVRYKIAKLVLASRAEGYGFHRRPFLMSSLYRNSLRGVDHSRKH